MSLATFLSYGIIVQYPSCERMRDVIWQVVQQNIVMYSGYAVLLLTVNFVSERYLEKRKTSREFIVLTLVQIAVLLLMLSYASWEFSLHCGTKT